MSIEATLRELAASAEPKLVELLLRAYELGYRDALSVRPAQAGGSGTTPQPPVAAELAVEATDTERTSAGEGPELDDPFLPDGPSERSGLFDFSAEQGGASATESPSEATGTPATRVVTVEGATMAVPLIRASARVGTLVERIHYYFGLQRFDVDIVVCRKGDANRRQLRSDVRLSRYAVSE